MMATLSGPVTEGDFFAAGAPFNLLVPGFIELDPITFTQAGRLFGMHGAFGGSPPAPSGNGILAYIEFIVLGTGDSPIEPDGTVVSVPEPGTLALLAAGFAWLSGRWLFMRSRRCAQPRSPRFAVRRGAAIAACVALASLLIGGNAAAQLPPAIDLLPDVPMVMLGPSGGYPPTVAPAAGERIDRYAEQWGLDVEARVRLFVDVLAAVAHAHSHLVVHRDLKPSNILVTRNGVVKLLDFGVAALLGPTVTELTRELDPALTPGYAAPEQLLGRPVTTATDVHALGVVLFLLLSGKHPFNRGDESGSELARATLEQQPPQPSVVAPGAHVRCAAISTTSSRKR